MISRKISKKQGEKLKKEYNIHTFMETSAKNGDNIKKLFIEASKILYTNYYKYDNVNIFNNIIQKSIDNKLIKASDSNENIQRGTTGCCK